MEDAGKPLCRNAVIGDPEHAHVLLCAHYDTPSWRILPELVFPGHLAIEILYQCIEVLLLFLIPSVLLMAAYRVLMQPRLSLLVFVIAFAIELFLLQYGIPTRHHETGANAPLAVLLGVMEQLPEDRRNRVAILLFDHGTTGSRGARAWCKTHLKEMYTKLAVHVSVVGEDADIHLISGKEGKRASGYGTFKRVLKAKEDSRKMTLSRDDSSAFRCGVRLVTCSRMFSIPVVRHLRKESDRNVSDGRVQEMTREIIKCIESLGM